MTLRFIVLAVLAAVAAGPAAARPFTAKDLATLERVSDPRVSPDGRRVAYSLRVVDYEANTARQELWLSDLAEGATPRRIAGETVSAASPRWSRDGAALYFLSSQSGSSQVWRVDPTGGVPTQVTDLGLDVGAFKPSPDGRRLIVGLAVFADCATLACTKERLAARAARKASGQVHDRLFEATMARLEVMGPHRFALIAIARSNAGRGALARRLPLTARALLEASGIDTGGPRGALRIAAMSAVWVRVLQVWRDDEGALNRTMAEIDKRLRQMRDRLGRVGAGF
jgi:dipeptidyl aminopeptidase/acylaminoacyl peptidase